MTVEEILEIFKKAKKDNKVFRAACKYILTEKPNATVFEFGVARGNSLREIAKKLPEAKIYGFDWFKGITEDWWDTRKKNKRHRLKGAMHLKKEWNLNWRNLNFPGNVEIVYGLIEKSLEPFLKKNNPKDVSLIHFDCDTYTPHRHALFILTDIIKSQKPFIVFGDIIGYPNFRNHAIKAFSEFTEVNKDFNFKVIARNGRKITIKPI